MKDDEFYVGYLPEAPEEIASFVNQTVQWLLLLALGLGGGIAIPQQTIGVSRFEFTQRRSFEGVLQKAPYPHLVVKRPGKGESDAAALSRYLLVQPRKYGLSQELCGDFDGYRVAFEGKLIYRDDQTMIEAAPDTFARAGTDGGMPDGLVEFLGEYTLKGEIIDSKCYLGVMNPGALKAHRACAIRCISGGIPPMLLVRRDEGPPLYLLLVSRDGGAVNEQVLDMVAEPVEITGQVERHDDLLVFKADPATCKRLF